MRNLSMGLRIPCCIGAQNPKEGLSGGSRICWMGREEIIVVFVVFVVFLLNPYRV